MGYCMARGWGEGTAWLGGGGGGTAWLGVGYCMAREGYSVARGWKYCMALEGTAWLLRVLHD